MPIHWGAKPPPKMPHSYIRLLVVKAGGSAVVARLGPVLGLETHWDGERTIACTFPDECPKHGEVITWKGYCPGIAAIGRDGNGRPSWKRCVLVVTPEITADVDALQVGRPFIIARPGASKRSPLEIRSTSTSACDPLPDSFAVQPYVCRAMNIPYEFAGKLRLRVAK